jgi:glutamate racemase
VEKGILEGNRLEDRIKYYLEPLLMENIDVLVLGCTHFPMIEKPILKVSGNGIKVISSAVETAKDVRTLLIGNDMAASHDNKVRRLFYETSSCSNFFKTGQMFLGEEIKKVVRAKLDI